MYILCIDICIYIYTYIQQAPSIPLRVSYPTKPHPFGNCGVGGFHPPAGLEDQSWNSTPKDGREMTVQSLGRFVDERWSRLNCVADFVVSFFSSNSRCMTVRWIGVKLGLDHFTGMSMVGT